MTVYLRARTVSRSVKERLSIVPLPARVLAVFDRVVDLVTDEGEVVALVMPQVGDGPLNVVVEGGQDAFSALEAGMAVVLRRDLISVEDRLVVSLGNAIVWEPCPDWDALRARWSIIAARLSRLRAVSLRRAPPESLLVALGGGVHTPVVAAAREGIASLRSGWDGDMDALGDGVRRLAGLGSGLTPAGDDFLVGVMLRAWLAHPDPAVFCHVVSQEACSRTTTLSAAFLRAAGRGECTAAWHALLGALATGNEELVTRSVQEILAYGETSGADMLAGLCGIASCESTEISN